MKTEWPRGSEWRLWDLHVHSPGTKLHDGFASGSSNPWDAYCQKLNDSPVSVFGIADYFSADGFFATAREFRSRYRGSKKVFVPNIELRTAYVVNRAREEVNVHLIFNPFREGFEDRISQFLQALKTHETVGDERYVKASELATTNDFESATTSREFVREALVEVYGRSADLTQHVLIITAANNDGIRPERGVKRKALITDELDKFSDGFFGNAGNVEWYLKADRYETNDVSAQKPTLSGSDAHSLADLDAKLGKTHLENGQIAFQPNWIKADLTFEGLKQILYEPGSRIHIGQTPPVYHDNSRVLHSVSLSRTNGWFDEIELPLNCGLVSIIGQKGSGKSALAEVIAYAAGSWINSEQGSFIRRAGNHLRDLTVTLRWADGQSSVARLGEPQPGDRKVRYLSQRFVERLCTEDRLGTELVREIEDVVFAHIDPTDTLNASDFEELRALKTTGIREERDRLKQLITALIHEECDLKDEEKKLSEKKARIRVLRDEEVGLRKQMPQPQTEQEKKLQAALQKHRDELTAIQQTVAGDKQRLQKIADIRTKISAFRGRITGFLNEITPLLNDTGIPETERAALIPGFPDNVSAPLDKRANALLAQIAKREGAEENPADGTIRWHEAKIKALTIQESADQTRQKRVKEIQSRISAIAVEIKRIEEEIRQIEGANATRMKTAYAERVAAFGALFENLKLEQQALRDLYEPLRKELSSVDSVGAGEKDLEFSIRWEVDITGWLKRGEELFDKRMTLPYGNFRAISEKAREILLPALSSGEPESIKAAHNEFLEGFRASQLHPRDYLCEGVERRQLYEWLYETDHVNLTYGLKYNGTELEKLSPGTKGIVLLILYLGIDTADTRPLIVDQPDENLDNESIYDLLRTYFQRAKVRRQVILISHNPNLVVNADSEQVLIATNTRRENGLPSIRYQMGALEQSAGDGTGVRERACRILEGGDAAFLRRESRYAISRTAAQDDGEAVRLIAQVSAEQR